MANKMMRAIPTTNSGRDVTTSENTEKTWSNSLSLRSAAYAAGDDAEDSPDHAGKHDERRRVDQTRADDPPDGIAVRERDAKSAGQQPRGPGPVLRVDPLVEPHLELESVQAGGRGRMAEDCIGGVARQDLGRPKDNDGDDHKGEEPDPHSSPDEVEERVMGRVTRDRRCCARGCGDRCHQASASRPAQPVGSGSHDAVPPQLWPGNAGMVPTTDAPLSLLPPSTLSKSVGPIEKHAETCTTPGRAGRWLWKVTQYLVIHLRGRRQLGAGSVTVSREADHWRREMLSLTGENGARNVLAIR